MNNIASSDWLPLIGGSLTIMLCVISFFLNRLLLQFDQLTSQVGVLNETMKCIDKDLSNEVGILKARLSTLQQSLDDINPIWDRLRAVETGVVAIKSGGCSIIDRCRHE